MSAELFDHAPGPIERPRTVGAIRRALPPELRPRFQDALDTAAPEDLFSLVAQWGAVAQTATDAGADAAADAVRAGTANTYEIGEVLPALGGLL
ncbi:hypothetical protein [Actinacidiphila sp. ITFR-21]|uniref:hypothetical protein n=1 Tax=Actinacidiphila sp. ITFR-21 TaxID=3075199 RepID=UPI002889FB68|nr:hypothetical protein [Streptomyces sp. ITFR-21]WNI19945.1 hypothetical protein RLT57_30860 [Streptomyces sp. ITFR-21]